jgi:hypothetical protein
MEYRREKILREVRRDRARLEMIAEEYRVIGRDVVVQGERVVPLHRQLTGH